jgi:hypothetical protein
MMKLGLFSSEQSRQAAWVEEGRMYKRDEEKGKKSQ